MKVSSTWRRHRLAGYAVLVLALAALGFGYAALSPGGGRARAAEQPSQATIDKGKELFQESCASCHGTNAAGTDRGPSILGAGPAAVHFQVSTGRMPLANPYGAQAPSKGAHFNENEIRAMAAYVGSLSPGGPPIPTDNQVAYKNSDLGVGGKLYRANCASCHSSAGSGNVLTYGKEVPALGGATPRQLYEAMQTGPAAMPKFTDSTIKPKQKRAIIHYVKRTTQEPNPGGFGLGRVGPVPEGLTAWLVGIGLLVLVAIWITARKHD